MRPARLPARSILELLIAVSILLAALCSPLRIKGQALAEYAGAAAATHGPAVKMPRMKALPSGSTVRSVPQSSTGRTVTHHTTVPGGSHVTHLSRSVPAPHKTGHVVTYRRVY
jgi:hypothetical protein